MKITMISNYINHHQIPFSEALYEKIGDDYTFIQTEPMEEERVLMGWGVDVRTLPYVKVLYQSSESDIRTRIDDCDILLVGWMEREDLIRQRLESGKLTIRISERLYREGQYKAVSPRGLIRKYKEHTKYRNSNVYLLCAGAYVPSDFHIVRAYPNKMFRFGYFPKTRVYNGNSLFEKKPDLSVLQIVWAGRFIPLKHPEFAIRLAADLRARQIPFHIHFIGDGEMKEQLLNDCKAKALSTRFKNDACFDEENETDLTFYGFLEPEKVRDIMEMCHIHLFTSNYLEGWGAVVNEGMNSGLAEVVNSQVGAAPYLIKHGKNGLIYKEGSYEDFLACVLSLVNHKEKITEYGRNAYQTITTEWNAKHAVKELICFFENWKKGKQNPPKEGPFSVAPVISPRKMYQTTQRGTQTNADH